MEDAFAEQFVDVDVVQSQHVDELHGLAAFDAIVFELQFELAETTGEFEVVFAEKGQFLFEGVEGEVVGVGGEGLEYVAELAEDVAEDGRVVGGELYQQILDAMQVLLQRLDFDSEVLREESVEGVVDFAQLLVHVLVGDLFGLFGMFAHYSIPTII